MQAAESLRNESDEMQNKLLEKIKLLEQKIFTHKTKEEEKTLEINRLRVEIENSSLRAQLKEELEEKYQEALIQIEQLNLELQAQNN